MKFIISILLFMPLVMACKSSKKEVSSTNENIVITYKNSTPVKEDCYYPRKTIRTIENESGTIAIVADTYIIATDPNGRYQPCDMPVQFQTEGLQVIFSGDKLELSPNERRFASPFRLQSLSPKN